MGIPGPKTGATQYQEFKAKVEQQKGWLSEWCFIVYNLITHFISKIWFGDTPKKCGINRPLDYRS